MKNTSKNIALLVISTVIAVLLAELLARAALHDITTTTDNRSYFATRWKRSHVRRNSLGFRDDEPLPDSQTSYRIAFIGDSFTFGQGIAEQDRMSNLVERELQRHRAGVDVVNLGNPGNNTAHEVEVLEMAIARLKPDFVLLQWFVNDVEIAETGAARSARQRSALQTLRARIHNWSALYFLASEVWHKAREYRGLRYEDYLRSQVGDPASPQAVRAEEAMVRFLRTCRDHNIPVGVILLPHLAPASDGAPSPFAYLHERVLGICAREGVRCIDMQQVFERYLRSPSYRDLWVNRFDSHMSPRANRVAAHHLLTAFGAEWAGSPTASIAWTVLGTESEPQLLARRWRKRRRPRAMSELIAPDRPPAASVTN